MTIFQTFSGSSISSTAENRSENESLYNYKSTHAGPAVIQFSQK